jgi:5-methylcytosine-specific restriction endonuclease McrA
VSSRDDPRHRNYRQRRRAAEEEARQAGIEFTKYDVAEWCNWICGICYRPIDSAEELSIDHIRPLSRGGRHTPDNVVAAHILCNSVRGGFDGQRLAARRRARRLAAEKPHGKGGRKLGPKYPKKAARRAA